MKRSIPFIAPKAHAVKPSTVFPNELYRNRQLITAGANAFDPTKAGYQLPDQPVRKRIVRISHRTLLSNGSLILIVGRRSRTVNIRMPEGNRGSPRA